VQVLKMGRRRPSSWIMSHTSGSAVLFVDDEPQVLRGFRDALRKEAYDILTVGSAALALGVLSRAHVDIVVSDERMPVMSGAELLERVGREYPRVVRIMLTGQASLEASIRAIKGGIYRFLTKPIEPSELRRVIAAALIVSHQGAA
jgi:two-component system, probable response regulator PhcQ